MKKIEKFTVILSHYNQMEYIEHSIKSIMLQNYNNIELIVADDCSKNFNKEIVEKIIQKYNKKKFKYKILQGKNNVGTVKNLNNAIKASTGDFILFFAADDILSNNNVITNFVNEFKDSTKNIITAQCALYDKDLNVKFCDYVAVKSALKLNQKSSNTIYEKMCEGCFYGSGGTAYRKVVFNKYGLFNENYIYVEDWAYWVYVLRMGEKMYYANFDALSHRDGGISHSTYTRETLPLHVRQYYKDILNIYKYEVIPYLNRFTTKQKYRILRQFNETILYYSSFVPELSEYIKIFDEARLSNNKVKYYWKIKTLFRFLNVPIFSKVKNLLKYNKVMFCTILMWILLCLIINGIFVNISNQLLLIIDLILYLILYCFIYIAARLRFYLKNKYFNR